LWYSIDSIIGYSVAKPYASSGNLLNIMDPAEHGKRRRVWDRAFTPTAVKSYDPMLHARVGQFVSELEHRVGQTVDIADWFGFFTFDFMGDFAFAGAFDCMKDGKDTHGFHDLSMNGLYFVEKFGTMPWLRPIILSIPGLGIGKFSRMAMNAARTRQESGSQIRDLFFYLVSWASCRHLPIFCSYMVFLS
jgi:cytochrome P450